MRKWIDLFESAEEHEFERLVWEIRNNYDPDFQGNCEAAAAELSERLSEMGIRHKVIQGMYDHPYDDGEVQAERSSHVWVEIDGYILDPTAEQFGTDETVIPMASEAARYYEGYEVMEESLNEAEEDGTYIDAHRSGTMVVIDMMHVPAGSRLKGEGTRYYEQWEASLPKDIELVRLWACDAGAGLTTPFWERLGFEYQFDTKHDMDDFSDADWTTWMWKGVNGHPTPATMMITPEEHD